MAHIPIYSNRFTVVSNAHYVMGTRGAGRLNGTLYDATYKVVTSGYWGSGEDDNFRIERDLTNGTYYLEVLPTSYVGAYTVHLEGPGAPTVSDDHGFSCWSATVVAPGSAVAGAIDVEADQDFFRFTVPANTNCIMETRGSGSLSGTPSSVMLIRV